MILQIKNNIHTLIIKLFYWRNWSVEILYLPLTLYVFFIGSFSAKNLFYFAAANPKIPLGGFANDSKFAILKQVPEAYKPKTIFIGHDTSIKNLLEKFDSNNFTFPIFVKPDLGEGGFLVKKINSVSELLNYHSNHKMNYLLQECINFSLELSFLVHNTDGELKISSLTERQYLTVIGDGISSLKQLLCRDKKAKTRLNLILNRCELDLNLICSKDVKYQPVSIGNWDFGATYIERTEIVTNELTSIINNINQKINLFNYARYDIKCKSMDDFLKGEFKILEINGVKGEPIHIYDKKYSLIKAYKEIFKHWDFILKISKRNISNGFICPSWRQGFTMLWEHQKTKQLALQKK